MSRIAPGLTVVAAAIALWLASGVEPVDVARYLGYELGFVILPGWLLFRAISPSTRSRLTQFAIGWPLGLVAEIAFFSLTAALDFRDAFYTYPLVVGIPAALLWRRRSGAPRDPGAATSARGPDANPSFSANQVWVMAGLCLVAFAYLGLTLIAQSPIPGSVPEVHYEQDNLFHVSLAAEALHHWPLTTPQVSGVDLGYHYFVHLHVASISQVTGIELPTVYFRLFLFPLVALALGQLGLVGRAISGIGWVGPITVALFLLVWELDLITPDLAPWFGINLILVWTGPSYALALTLLLPLTLLFAALLEPRILARLGLSSRSAAWTCVGVLAVGVAGAKVAALPVIGGALGTYVAWTLLRERRLDRTALIAGGLCAAVFLAFIPLLYDTGGGLRLGPGGIYEFIPALLLLEGKVPDSLPAEVAFWSIGSVAATLLLFGPPLLGLAWILGSGRPPPRPGQRLLLCCLAVGLLLWLLLNHDVAAQFYFGFYGLVLAMPVAAEGLYRGLSPWLADPRRRGRAALLGGAWAAVLAVVLYGAWQLRLDGHGVRAYLLAYGVLFVALAAIGAYALVRRERRAAATALACLVIFVPAGLDIAYDTGPETVRRLNEGESLYNEYTKPGITPDEVAAAEWIRDNLPEEAVLTIDNQRQREARRIAPYNTEFPAFAERRAFYEGWAYAGRSSEIGRDDVTEGRVQPYPVRHRLEQRLFRDGDRRAAWRMRRDYGVTHLVVVRGLGAASPSARDLGRVVYRNPRVEVIELDGISPGLIRATPRRP